MKKHTRIPLLFLVVFLFLVLTPASVSASENKSQAKETSGFLQLYKTENNLASGLKLRLWRNLHTGANIEYYASNRDTKLHLTGIYLLPHEFIFFRFMAAPAISFPERRLVDFYLVLGSHYAFISKCCTPGRTKPRL